MEAEKDEETNDFVKEINSTLQRLEDKFPQYHLCG